jgi:hypothetical protein
VVEAFGRGRVEVLGKAMGELTAGEQARLVAALPALSRLGEILEGRPAPSEPSEPRAEGAPHE